MTAGPQAQTAQVEEDGGTPSSGARRTAPGAGSDFWSQLVAAQTSDQLCLAWLGILCQWIPQTEVGLLLWQQDEGSYAPAAVWPDPERDVSYLGGAAQQALVERRGVVREEAGGLTQCAYPLLGPQQAFGVVVLQLRQRDEAGLREALRVLHWGAGWLVGLSDKRTLHLNEQRLQRSGLVQDLLLGTLAEATAADAARWTVNRLVEALPCRQALLTRTVRGTQELQAVSGSAGFDARTTLLATAVQAMTEAASCGVACHHPPLATSDGPVDEAASRALAEYALQARVAAALAMPLVQQGRTTGVLLIDWESAPADAERAFAASLGTALAPALALQTQATRGLGSHLRQATQAGWQALVGPRHAGAKLLAVVALLLLLAGQFVDGDYQVRAPATIEGQVLRAAVAAYDGYIASAPVRAGDTVHAGDVLARLDDRDLQLEFNKSSADTELADRRLREALARGEAVAIRIAQAEAQQAGAELALVKARLAHTVITSPLDGLVVRGDLSQQLGAPVEQGKVLFEVAPLDAWRVVLKVDERDIVMLRVGQSAELVLAGLPGVQHALEVTRISPLAVAEDGRNSFRVEARVLNAVTAIQPGMEGVGRIRAGRRPWLWIGLHRLADWFSYTAWTWGL